MVLKPLTYTDKNKKININVKPCTSIWSKFSGLIFKSNSPPLLFVFNKQKTLTIHSLFCKPFKAIWLDEKKTITKQQTITKPLLNISGYGKYLLEIPLDDKNNPTRTTKKWQKQEFLVGKISETFKYKTDYT